MEEEKFEIDDDLFEKLLTLEAAASRFHLIVWNMKIGCDCEWRWVKELKEARESFPKLVAAFEEFDRRERNEEK